MLRVGAFLENYYLQEPKDFRKRIQINIFCFVLGYHIEEHGVGDRSSNLQWIGNQNNEELRVYHQYSPNQK